MKLKLSDWASVAEITSGIAVVVTLIFLVSGVRENTDVTRASMYQRSTDQLIQWRNQMIEDPEISQLFQAFMDGDLENISGVGEVRLRQLVLNIFQIYEQAYFSNQYGLLGGAEWTRFERQICRFHEGAQASEDLVEALNNTMTEEFWMFTNESCEL